MVPPVLLRPRHRQVTARHLEGVRAIALACGGPDACAAAGLVTNAEGAVAAFYGSCSQGQLSLMRQTLLRCAGIMRHRRERLTPASYRVSAGMPGRMHA